MKAKWARRRVRSLARQARRDSAEENMDARWTLKFARGKPSADRTLPGHRHRAPGRRLQQQHFHLPEA